MTLEQIKDELYARIMEKTGIVDPRDIKPGLRAIIDSMAELFLLQQKQIQQLIENMKITRD